MKHDFKVGDWAAYNWLDEDGNDDWKIGRIIQTNSGLMYYNDDWTSRSGFIPLTSGVKKLSNN